VQLTLLGYSFAVDETVVDVSPAELRRQVAAYARGDRREFALSVAYPDDFTGDVMRAMAAIPYGETRTYGDLAARLETSAVAVGGACGRNPIPVVVPCHRVVGSDSVGGFSASGGVAAKEALLAHERGEPRQQTLSD
jgi:methylated-DNA-[protein]-cysteine S-methyltransferase